MSEDDPTLSQIHAELREAVQKYVNYAAQVERTEAALVDQVLVSYELVKFDGGGDTVRSINYTVASDNFSPSAYLGLAEASRALIRQEILGWNEEEQG